MMREVAAEGEADFGGVCGEWNAGDEGEGYEVDGMLITRK